MIYIDCVYTAQIPDILQLQCISPCVLGVMYGDTPVLANNTLAEMIELAQGSCLTVSRRHRHNFADQDALI